MGKILTRFKKNKNAKAAMIYTIAALFCMRFMF